MNAVTVQSNGMQDVITRYKPYLQDCHDYLVARLSSVPATAALAEYIQGGKMLRALLVFIVTSATGNQPRKMIKAASALELLHGASLIHDDVIDEATTRRGRPALHVQMGLGPALVLGDYLILLAFAVLRETDTVYDRDRILEALCTMNHYARECCLGELDELQPSGRLDPEEEYLTIVRGKTASQFAAAATVPAILGGETLVDIEALRTYGLNLGIAFQIHDDVLDLIGDATLLGKPVGVSPAKGRPMLPLIYLERYGSLSARRLGCRLIQRMEQGGRVELVGLLKEEGILDRVAASQDKYVSVAMQALDRLRLSEEVEALKALASYATTHRSTHTLDGMTVRQ